VQDKTPKPSDFNALPASECGTQVGQEQVDGVVHLGVRQCILLAGQLGNQFGFRGCGKTIAFKISILRVRVRLWAMIFAASRKLAHTINRLVFVQPLSHARFSSEPVWRATARALPDGATQGRQLA
jgi:hypothetical protein